jgi:hypothetical protein
MEHRLCSATVRPHTRSRSAASIMYTASVIKARLSRHGWSAQWSQTRFFLRHDTNTFSLPKGRQKSAILEHLQTLQLTHTVTAFTIRDFKFCNLVTLKKPIKKLLSNNSLEWQVDMHDIIKCKCLISCIHSSLNSVLPLASFHTFFFLFFFLYMCTYTHTHTHTHKRLKFTWDILG